jgi:hypothetical protein
VATTYPTDDRVIADVVATDTPYRADDRGTTASITIPQHVTLRGDWRDPDQGSGPYGTVVLASPAPGGETDPGLFRIGERRDRRPNRVLPGPVSDEPPAAGVRASAAQRNPITLGLRTSLRRGVPDQDRGVAAACARIPAARVQQDR